MKKNYIKILILSLVFVNQITIAADGDLDPSFNPGGTLPPGQAGLITTSFGASTTSLINGLKIQTDCKIVVAGVSNPFGANVFAGARYNIDGRLDTTFNSAGFIPGTILQEIVTGEPSEANDLAIQSNGSIVFAGTTGAGGNNDFALLRLLANGTPDGTFGIGGIVTTDFGEGSNDEANAVALQSNGRIVAVGSSNETVPGAAPKFALANYNTDGILNGGFNGTGLVAIDVSGIGEENSANDVAVQTDNKIIAVGQTGPDGDQSYVITRFNTNGTLDTTFSGTGIVIDKYSALAGNHTAFGVVIQPDGKIVIAGLSGSPTTGRPALARYNTDGTLDTSFGNGGKLVVTSLPDLSVFLAVALSGSKIVAVGQIAVAGVTQFLVMRFNADGTVDTTFGTNGFVITAFPGFTGGALANDVDLDCDGKIVAGGAAESSTETDFALARYLNTITPPVPPIPVCTEPADALTLAIRAKYGV